MILRKPYAFFIKHFRLIHMILALLMSYSLYRTKIILDFFNEYASTTMSVVGQDLMETFFYGFIFLVPIFIILVTIIIMVVMGVKKKPTAFYGINILIFIYTLVILFVASSTLATLQINIIDLRTTRLVRDLIMVSFLSQILSVVIVFVRATGFNIKKFDFKKDLQELNIEDTDSEEFELEFKLDKNKTRRNLKRSYRFLKYAYRENKLFAHILLGIMVVVIGVSIFLGYSNKQPILNETNSFSGNAFSLSVTDSYLTNKDYKGNVIDENYYYLIVRIKIKATSSSNVLDMATTKVIIDKFVYTPTLNKKDLLFSFGNIYNDEVIGQDYEIKDLIYQIPKQLIEKDIIFSYVSKNKVGNATYDDTKVKLDVEALVDSNKVIYNLNDTVKFEGVLNGYRMVINSMEISKKFKFDYIYSINSETFASYEYIKPSLTSNYDKALLKISGSLVIGDVKLSNINDLYDFIYYFGKLHYVIGGEEYTQNVDFKERTPQKTNQGNTYYIEILNEVLKADKISLVFKVNDKNFEYILK